jgi:primary-amine oxidase
LTFDDGAGQDRAASAAKEAVVEVRRSSALLVILTGLGFLCVGAVVVAQTLVPTSRGREQAPLAASAAVTDPLDPLTTQEINRTMRTIERDSRFPADAVFPLVTLKEPTKAELAAGGFPRRSFTHLYDRAANRLYEVVVDPAAQTVLSWTAKPAGTQPAVWGNEFDEGDAVVRADPRFAAKMAARGINDPENVYIDVWAPGELPVGLRSTGHRFLRAIFFYRGTVPNPYNRPIEGLTFTMDMTTRKVVEIIDTVVRPVSRTAGGSTPPERSDLAPLQQSQPGGQSFTIDGRNVSWQRWHFRVDYGMREGLILHGIGYEDGNRIRPIIHRIAMSEVYVPYGLNDPNWSWRTAMDIGEYNLGQYAEPLRKNVDVPETAEFFDEVVASDTGSVDGAYALPNAVAVYERDSATLWDRTDPSTFDRDARFGRELVVAAAYVIGNYTYMTEYAFQQDGTIAVQVGSMGTTLNRGVRNAAEGNTSGSLVAPNIAAPDHQHFFNFRIDFDVDGTANRVRESNTAMTGGASENGFATTATTLATEQFRDGNAPSNRSWIVESTNKTNALGDPTAYAILPSAWNPPYSGPNYPPLGQAAFAKHQVWFTKAKDAEAYAAGDYVNQGQAGEGLPAFISPAENINGQDVVAWYTAAFSHHPHPEEFPTMSNERIRFRLAPLGFFDRYPALDVPDQRGN